MLSAVRQSILNRSARQFPRRETPPGHYTAHGPLRRSRGRDRSAARPGARELSAFPRKGGGPGAARGARAPRLKCRDLGVFRAWAPQRAAARALAVVGERVGLLPGASVASGGSRSVRPGAARSGRMHQTVRRARGAWRAESRAGRAQTARALLVPACGKSVPYAPGACPSGPLGPRAGATEGAPSGARVG